MTADSSPTNTLASILGDELWTPRQVAEFRHTSEHVLAQERYLGRGPKYVSDGRRIRYRTSDLREYFDANTETPGRSVVTPHPRD